VEETIDSKYDFCKLFTVCGSWVSVVTELQTGWPGFDFWQCQEIFTLHHCIQTGSGVHPGLYHIGIEDKVAGAWRWPLTSI
jgi:hypothetical protein